MKSEDLRRIAILVPGVSTWRSLREILPAIVEGWKRFANSRGAELSILLTREVRGQAELNKRISLAWSADILVVTASYHRVMRDVKLVRRTLGGGPPLVLYCHGEAVDGLGRMRRYLSSLNKGDRWVVASRAEYAALKHRLPSSNIHVISHPIGVKKYTASRDQSKAGFLFAGRIVPEKNLHTLIYSYRLYLSGTRNPIPLRIAGVRSKGDSAYKSFIDRLTVELGLSAYVKWEPEMDTAQLNRFLHARNYILIAPSLALSEDYGVVAVRALLAGQRVVLSNWGGHRDLKANFPNQVLTAPCFHERSRRYVCAEILAKKMTAAAYLPPSQRAGRTQVYQPPHAASKIARMADGLRMGSEVGESLVIKDKVDLDCWEAYGALPSKKRVWSEAKNWMLVPWARFEGRKIGVRDPMSGPYEILLRPGRLSQRSFEMRDVSEVLRQIDAACVQRLWRAGLALPDGKRRGR